MTTGKGVKLQGYGRSSRNSWCDETTLCPVWRQDDRQPSFSSSASRRSFTDVAIVKDGGNDDGRSRDLLWVPFWSRLPVVIPLGE